MTNASTFTQRVTEAVADERLHLAVLSATAERDLKRLAAWADLPDIQALRDLAARIKDHTLDHLDQYIQQFTESLDRLGAHVHFAGTADDANETVVKIARQYGCTNLVKGKSMLTEELGLNAVLERCGLSVVETDLGEYLLQLDGDTPSHITAPALHKDIASCAQTFSRHLNIRCTEDPAELVRIARHALRDVFRGADMAITGANFAVADSGAIVLVMNEGNGRFCTLRPKVHVAMIGIEKIIPSFADLAVMLKLLARSASGQKITVDTQFIVGPRRQGDSEGPQHLHVVLVDAGRSRILAGPQREVLRCIRCGACLNTCPVYRSIGGHAYGGVYPGPIGQLLTPLLSDMHAGNDLPSASSLCGACADACPVNIDIPRHLRELRSRLISGKAGIGPGRERRAKARTLRLAMWFMRSPWRYRLGQRLIRAVLRRRARDGWVNAAPGPLKGWTSADRDLPAPPPRSFREHYEQEGKRS